MGWGRWPYCQSLGQGLVREEIKICILNITILTRFFSVAGCSYNFIEYTNKTSQGSIPQDDIKQTRRTCQEFCVANTDCLGFHFEPDSTTK